MAKYTNQELLQHASAHDLIHHHLIGNCQTCANSDSLAQCLIPKEQVTWATCISGCKKWLESKCIEGLTDGERDKLEREITEEREHWNRILNVAKTYACCSCKICEDDKKHCTPQGCSIKWALEKQRKEKKENEKDSM